MAKGRRARTTGGGRKAWIAVALVASALAVGALALLRGMDDAPAEDARVTSFPDVHGLAVSPDDPEVVFVATHAGLMRGEGAEWWRVGAMRDDLMGFTAHPRDAGTFWTSGHPQGGGNMGVRRSTDGGRTWTTVWDERVDFHAMATSGADPDRLWGFYAGKLHRSDDAGATWSVVAAQPPPIRALAAHPTDAERLWAVTPTGIQQSADGGRTWAPLATLAAFGIAVDPTDGNVLYAGGQDRLWRSADGGATWTDLPVPAPGTYAYLAVSAKDPRVVVAATYETAVHRSSDAGATWTRLHAGR